LRRDSGICVQYIFHANHLQHLDFLALSSSSVTARREGKRSVTRLTLFTLQKGVSLGVGEDCKNLKNVNYITL